jgi:hypothetical protein
MMLSRDGAPASVSKVAILPCYASKATLLTLGAGGAQP